MSSTLEEKLDDTLKLNLLPMMGVPTPDPYLSSPLGFYPDFLVVFGNSMGNLRKRTNILTIWTLDLSFTRECLKRKPLTHSVSMDNILEENLLPMMGVLTPVSYLPSPLGLVSDLPVIFGDSLKIKKLRTKLFKIWIG